ncbi:hypothetical protein PVIIG_04799 [Plasmodium vivax India VII]|uniref:Zinc knuckle domain containing protein n=4 Tax=Plasmodium vivax TaxID=5855 RepID=A5KB14_PLAVS|nr:hypothetical protein, conserved [Plasmodium vivax]EDL43531.1 hypothetical protein, conserved [Plasmodium vivax]KMZ80001.1 hypothetical protein PVIIG_04799 [Plasmodium vivax India VII]KMZ92735.1 hypothetical protein PVMG_01322 [Plasmodium vivax Mauritania I]SCO67811.1 conserved Plasmodium protein, unknown function [Plasmodium vivax]|eukprot:XP_001613258.1 hypothetical protein [Plasmodium vivax Sal-1]
MPSKAGRVRMPPDNRLPVSASLKTSDIWKNSVGYDPYASVEEINKRELKKKEATNEEINEKAKSLFSLARLTGTASATIPGACSLCNHIGHLPYQCRNLISLEKLNFQRDIKEEAEDDLKERRNLGIVSDSGGSSGSSSDDCSSSDGGSSSDSGSSSGGRGSRDSARERRRKEKHKRRRRKREGRSRKEERRSHKGERRRHKEKRRSRKEERQPRKHAKRTGRDKSERRRHSSRDRDKSNVKKEKRKRRTSETDEEGGRAKRHRGRSSSS